jgi:hypothetical protein
MASVPITDEMINKYINRKLELAQLDELDMRTVAHAVVGLSLTDYRRRLTITLTHSHRNPYRIQFGIDEGGDLNADKLDYYAHVAVEEARKGILLQDLTCDVAAHTRHLVAVSGAAQAYLSLVQATYAKSRMLGDPDARKVALEELALLTLHDDVRVVKWAYRVLNALNTGDNIFRILNCAPSFSAHVL